MSIFPPFGQYFLDDPIEKEQIGRAYTTKYVYVDF
jgi:hypothetical protein